MILDLEAYSILLNKKFYDHFHVHIGKKLVSEIALFRLFEQTVILTFDLEVSKI